MSSAGAAEHLARQGPNRLQQTPAPPLAERCTMAHAGSSVVRGRGLGLVVPTGQAKEVGSLAIDLQAIPPGRPPLLLRMDRFSRTIALLVGWPATAWPSGR